MSKKLSQAYHSLHVMLNAGLPLLRAMENVSKRGSLGRKFNIIRERVRAGDEIGEAMEDFPSTFSDFDVSIVKVGESSGNLPECFEHLASWYELLHKMKKLIIGGLIYPMFIFHFAGFIVPFPSLVLRMIRGEVNWVEYFMDVIGFLSLLYIPGMIIFCIYTFFPRRGILRNALDIIALRIPMIGKAILYMNLSRFTRAFYISSKAGVPYIETLELALRALNNQELVRRLKGGISAAKEGNPISSGFRHMPFDFLDLWRVGEETGDLDDIAGKLTDMYDYEAERRITAIARTIPWIIYIIVMIILVIQILMLFFAIVINMTQGIE